MPPIRGEGHPELMKSARGMKKRRGEVAAAFGF
jgi:hypothetical protein